MKQTSFSLYKLYVSLFALTALLCVGSLELNAQTIFSFTPGNWTVVDKTFAYDAPPGGSFTHLTGTRYRLTDTFQFQKIGMGHHQQINLSQDFIFQCKIEFGNGKLYNNPLGLIADGVVFALSLSPPTIGEGTWYIGYGNTYTPKNSSSPIVDQMGSIIKNGDSFSSFSTSLAIEFDTEWEHWNSPTPDFDEGGAFYGNGCHTAYLKNGNMTALPGTYSPMLDNFATVRGQELCISIHWKRTNGVDGSAGYDLITYIEGIERNNMHFNTLDDAIQGLSAANGKVYWSITSATCGIPNRHEIEFISLFNGDDIDSTIRYSTHTGHIGGEGFPVDTFGFGKYSMDFACSPISEPSTVDTITYSHPICDNKFPYFIHLDGDAAYILNNAKWSAFNGSNYVSVPTDPESPNDFKINDIFNANNSTLLSQNPLIIRLILDGNTVYYKFNKNEPK